MLAKTTETTCFILKDHVSHNFQKKQQQTMPVNVITNHFVLPEIEIIALYLYGFIFQILGPILSYHRRFILHATAVI